MGYKCPNCHKDFGLDKEKTRGTLFGKSRMWRGSSCHQTHIADFTWAKESQTSIWWPRTC